MTRRYLILGESYPITLGASEVIMHMRMTGQTRLVEIREAGAYIDGRTHVTHGEAGVYGGYAAGIYYVHQEEHAALRNCATVGCTNAASQWIQYHAVSVSDPEMVTDGCCARCADGYLRRPSLGATRVARPDVDNVYVYGTGARDDGMAYAVGVLPPGGPANGSLALFQQADDARLFARARAEQTGATLSVLPSAEEVRA